jgi:DNA-binding MarR family transcriptional regulator
MERLAVRELVSAYEAYRRMLARILGVGVTEANALAELWYMGPLTASELTERISLTSPSVTALVDRMELAELVVRRRHPADRRSVIIELTGRGAATLQNMWEMFVDDVESVLQTTAPEHVEELNHILERIASALSARAADPASTAAALVGRTAPTEQSRV